jgi:uncharacterized LabA/DUF88 family protein
MTVLGMGMLGSLYLSRPFSEDTKMKKRTAIVFIDGNNFYHNLRGFGITPNRIDLSKLSELVCEHFDCDYNGTRYYNSVPDIKESEIQYYNHMKFLKKISELPKFEVLTRKIQTYDTKRLLGEKKNIIDSLELCKACKPLVESNCLDCIGKFRKKEKGIDVMVAVDMLKFCVLKDECDCCILISGDADFVPASEIILEEGKEVFSAFIPHGYSWELRNKLPFWTLSRSFLLNKYLR